MSYTVGVTVAECFKVSQDSTSGCLMVMPATSESWDFPGRKLLVRKGLNT